jgi:SAM-dependent methyltransferase
MDATSEKTALYRFYQQVGQCYPEEEEVYNTLRGHLRKAFVLQYLSTRQGRFLDIGCNRGLYLHHYAGGDAVGVDISLPVLQRMHRADHVHVLVADAERLHCLRESTFDHALCSEVLEHCLEPDAVMAGIAHALKPGGQALITTPNYRKQKPKWIGLGVLREYGVDCSCNRGYYHTAFHPDELAGLAERASLLVVETGTFEKEVKYAARGPALVLWAGRAVNRILRSNRWERANERLFQILSFTVYRLSVRLRVHPWLMRRIQNGPRSYIVVKKREQ